MINLFTKKDIRSKLENLPLNLTKSELTKWHWSESNSLFVSWREGKRSGKGFLDDYANEIFALITLYEATLDKNYLKHAKTLCDKCISLFCDETSSGFFLNGSENETLIMRPKETYDGAMPSGNSMLAYNLVRLSYYTDDKKYEAYASKQIEFMLQEASRYPSGYSMFLVALLDHINMPTKVTIVLKDKTDLIGLVYKLPLNAIIKALFYLAISHLASVSTAERSAWLRSSRRKLAFLFICSTKVYARSRISS